MTTGAEERDDLEKILGMFREQVLAAVDRGAKVAARIERPPVLLMPKPGDQYERYGPGRVLTFTITVTEPEETT